MGVSLQAQPVSLGSDLLPTAPQGSLPRLLLHFGSAGKNLLYLILFVLTCTLHFASL